MAMILARLARSGVGRKSCPARDRIRDSRTTIEIPEAMQEMKKSTGSIGVYQSACSRFGTIRYRDPKEDWCKVDSSTPKIMSGNEMVWIHLMGLWMFNFSRMIGANSRDSTVVYNMRHQLISHITECEFHMTSGCQKWSGRPRSMMRTRTTSRYPMKAVRIAGRTIGSYSLAWNRLTAATMVKPEAARPMPRKSKPIQSPQGNSSAVSYT